jgi:DNA mismatch endonuclease, patch repair protein
MMFRQWANWLLAQSQMRPAVSTSNDIDHARSAQMARVRGRDTKPELRVRRTLHAAGLRYRLQAKDLIGKPDLVFRTRRIAVFVHGCFWHQHPDPSCRLARMPKSKLEFWVPKLMGNRLRDVQVKTALEEQGWRVVEVWECQTKPEDLQKLVDQIRMEKSVRKVQRRSKRK